MNVYSVVKVLERVFCPSSGRSRESQKYKARAKKIEIFFIRPPNTFFSCGRKQKKTQLPKWVTGSQTLVYGIKGNKLRQNHSNRNKDSKCEENVSISSLHGRKRSKKFPYYLTLFGAQNRFSPMVNPSKMG